MKNILPYKNAWECSIDSKEFFSCHTVISFCLAQTFAEISDEYFLICLNLEEDYSNATLRSIYVEDKNTSSLGYARTRAVINIP